MSTHGNTNEKLENKNQKQDTSYSDYCKKSIRGIIIAMVFMVIFSTILSFVQLVTPATFCLLFGLVRIVALIPTPKRYGESLGYQADSTTKSNANTFFTIIFVFFGIFGGVSMLLEPVYEEWPNTVLMPLGVAWLFLSMLIMYCGWILISTSRTRSYVFKTLRTNISWDEARYLRILIGCLGQSDSKILSVRDMPEELRKSYLLELATVITGDVFNPIKLLARYENPRSQTIKGAEDKIPSEAVKENSNMTEKIGQAQKTTAEKLMELKNLKEQGLLTESEYVAKRQFLVDQLGK